MYTSPYIMTTPVVMFVICGVVPSCVCRACSARSEGRSRDDQGRLWGWTGDDQTVHGRPRSGGHVDSQIALPLWPDGAGCCICIRFTKWIPRSCAGIPPPG